MKGGWINHNRILKSNDESMYINVRVHKASVKTAINEMKLNNTEGLKTKILAQFEVYKKTAPYYDEVITFMKKCFEFETDSLSQLNCHTLKETNACLKIKCDIEVLSEMKLTLDKVNESDEGA